MWRIQDDHWDSWVFHKKPADGEFPFSTKDEFDRLAQWAPYVKPGNWPDPDMLPLGWLGPHPGWGDARQSRITAIEARTEFTLFAVSRSPLIFGGNLTKLDDDTRALMTNKELLDIDQRSIRSTPIPVAQKDGQPVPWRAWVAQTRAPQQKTYIAVFNLGDDPGTWDPPLDQLPAIEQAARRLRSLHPRARSARPLPSTPKFRPTAVSSTVWSNCDYRKACLSSGSKYRAAPCPCQSTLPSAPISTTHGSLSLSTPK